MKKYLLCLLLISFSLLGTGLTDFALSVWILDQPGSSVTSYSLVWFFQAAPAVLLSPFIGSLVDRWEKKKIIILGQLGAGIGSFSLMLIHFQGLLEPWHIMGVAAISSVANMFVFRAFYVSIVTLVSKVNLVKANGLSSTLYSIVQIGVPVAAPVLYKLIGLEKIFLIDIFTFLVSIIIFMFISLGAVPRSVEKFNLKADFKSVVAFMKEKKGFIPLTVFFFIISFLIGLIQVLFTPLILDFSNEYVLGSVLAFAGTGSLIGGIVMSSKKSFHNPLKGIATLSMCMGVVLLASFTYVNTYVLAIGGMLMLMMFTIVSVINSSFVQTIVPVDMQGRVSGFATLFIGIAAPAAYLLAGILVDSLKYLFNEFDLTFFNRFPGSTVTASIITIFAISGGILFLISMSFRKSESVKNLDSIYHDELESSHAPV
ncbi:MFS transporter [Flavobacteriaceae bacterium M23B6Z8]